MSAVPFVMPKFLECLDIFSGKSFVMDDNVQLK